MKCKIIKLNDIYYNYIYITFIHLAYAFIQSDLQMRTYKLKWYASAITSLIIYYIINKKKT